MQFGQLFVRWTSPSAVIAQRGPVLVINYRGTITSALMEATESAQRHALATQGNRCLLLCVVENSLPLPDEEARQSILSHFKKVSVHNTAFATVLLGDGFWAGAARSILSGLTLVVRPPCPSVTTGHLLAGARFLSTHTGDAPLDVVSLVTDVEAMRLAAAHGDITAWAASAGKS